MSELCFGRFQKEKLVTARRRDGSRAQLLLPPLQTPFGPQRGKSQGRWYLDLPLSDAEAVKILTELDAWAATAAQEAWPGCTYIPALKARQHLLPKVRARFSAALRTAVLDSRARSLMLARSELQDRLPDTAAARAGSLV